MSALDLSQGATATGTEVIMPDGKKIALKPLAELGAEHDDTLFEVVGALSSLTGTDEDGTRKNPGLEELKAVMPTVNKLLAAAAETPAKGKSIQALPLAARFQILMHYVQEQDLGGLMPSGS